MRVTRESDYAVRVLLVMAASPGERASASELSRRSGIPRPFLKKILTRLGREGIVHSTPGSAGGVILARPPESLTLLNVIEAVQGPLRLNLCLENPPRCPLAGSCTVQPVWTEVQERMKEVLAGVTLERLKGAGPAPCTTGLFGAAFSCAEPLRRAAP